MAERKATRWALIGASNIARKWMVDAIRSQPGHEICAVVSANQARADAFAAEMAIPRAFDSLERMLKNETPDAVYISTTNEKHAAQTIAAAEAGAHVVCEKPLALTIADAEAMLAACANAGVLLATNHHLRGAATHEKIRELIAAGILGDFVAARVLHAVYLPENLQGWRLADTAGGGVIADITVHDADIIAYLLGAYPREVTAFAQNAGMAKAPLEDGCMSIWQLGMAGGGGGLCYAHESFAVAHAGTGLEVHGSKASIIAHDVMTPRPTGTVSVRDRDGMRDIPLAHHNLYQRSMAHFAAAMNGDGRPLADGVDGVRSLAVALAVRQSAQERRAVSVDYGGYSPF